jgi:hypothetical protein
MGKMVVVNRSYPVLGSSQSFGSLVKVLVSFRTLSIKHDHELRMVIFSAYLHALFAADEGFGHLQGDAVAELLGRRLHKVR